MRGRRINDIVKKEYSLFVESHLHFSPLSSFFKWMNNRRYFISDFHGFSSLENEFFTAETTFDIDVLGPVTTT
jgi:hypothetical protein